MMSARNYERDGDLEPFQDFLQHLGRVDRHQRRDRQPASENE